MPNVFAHVMYRNRTSKQVVKVVWNDDKFVRYYVVGDVENPHPSEVAIDTFLKTHTPKCSRTVCENDATCTHTQDQRMYCVPCARKINMHNFDGLVEIPKPADGGEI